MDLKVGRVVVFGEDGEGVTVGGEGDSSDTFCERDVDLVAGGVGFFAEAVGVRVGDDEFVALAGGGHAGVVEEGPDFLAGVVKVGNGFDVGGLDVFPSGFLAVEGTKGKVWRGDYL